MLTTTVVPTAGQAELYDYDVATEPISARALSAVVFQDAVVDRARTGRRNLETHARLWGVPAGVAARRITAHTDEFELTDIIDRPVATYQLDGSRQYMVHRHGYLCGTPSVTLEIGFQQKLSAGFFGGEGFILQRVSGSGDAWIELDGEVVEYELSPGEVLRSIPAMSACSTPRWHSRSNE